MATAVDADAPGTLSLKNILQVMLDSHTHTHTHTHNCSFNQTASSLAGMLLACRFPSVMFHHKCRSCASSHTG